MPDLPARLQEALADRYVLERELGQGGMATVYLARDLKHDRDVALKVLRPELGSALGPERFLREIRLTARLSHPNILTVFDSGDAAGQLWYTVPYVAGGSLRQRLNQETQLKVPEALRIAGQVASALTHAHEHGIVHRDIKPENILLAGEQALVADFGLAKALDASSAEKLTETGLSLGTPAYMSPEQAAGGAVDARSDIYALGCVLYEMLAGVPPFTGPTAQAILARHAVDPVPPLRTLRRTIPENLELAVERALAKVPADRFATADEFVQALESGSIGRMPRRRAFSRKNRSIAAAFVMVAAAVGLGIWRFGDSAGTSVLPSASRMAVLPLLSLGGDTALARLGKDLANTISVSLDGVGGIEMADRLTIATSTAGSAGLSPTEGAALARRLGATSFVQGTLVGAGDRVRLDLGLYGTERLEPIASGVTITAYRDSIGALTDSASLGLIHQIWQRGKPPSPSLAAVTTRSLAALRGFLDGERALAADRWEDARLAFRSAIAADSTFWLAYFRYVLADGWLLDHELEPEILEALRLHRQSLPERERLLIEAFLTSEETLRLERLRLVAARFPEYWPAWFLYGDVLFHSGSELGHDWTDAVAALQRAVALEPKLAPAWFHIWQANVGKDKVAAAQAAARLAEIEDAPQFVGERLIQGVDHADGVIAPDLGPLADTMATWLTSEGKKLLPVGNVGMTLLRFGFPVAQIDLNSRALKSPRASSEVRTALIIGSAYAWAARGQWDSSLTIMSDAAAEHPGVLGSPQYRVGEGTGGPLLALESYALAVVSAFLGATPPLLADQRRPAALNAIRLLGDDASRHDAMGRLAWLDGVLAFARNDRAALLAARQDAVNSGYYQAKRVDRSLAAFELAQTGQWGEAGHALAALDTASFEGAEDGNGFTPGYAVQQLAAGQWLAESGDTEKAQRLLRWHDLEATYGAMWENALVYVLSGPSYLIRARLEKAHGDPQKAQYYYRQFLRRYDQPMASQVHLVEEAQAALAELSGVSDKPAP